MNASRSCKNSLSRPRQQSARQTRKKAQESKKARAEDTRRKVLVGATVLALMDSNQWTGPNITEMLAKHLTRNSDRALFGLYPITEEVLVPPSGLQDAKT